MVFAHVATHAQISSERKKKDQEVDDEMWKYLIKTFRAIQSN